MHLSSAPSSSVAQPSVRTAASSPLSAAAPSPEPGVRDWTCPFCPLLCDDITTIVHGDGTLDAPDVDCPRLARALTWSSVPGASQPAIDDQDADLESALQRAADILKRASRPLFGGLATDVAGARALYPLAAGCGAILDHLHGDAMAASTAALQDRGGFFTTLSEVRTRADLLIIFDCQPSLRYPRFYERMLGGTDHARDLIFVGCEVDPAADIVENTSTHSILKDADPYDILAIWSALTQGRTEASIHDGTGTGNAIAHALADLAGRVSAARYAVVVYEPAALPGPHPALLIEAVNRIVKAANRTTRAGALALGGDDGALSVNQAVTWLSGLPLRTRVSMPTRLADQPQLDHDPQRYRTQRLLSAHEVDALLWVASFQPEPLPPGLADNVPAIVLGHPAMRSMLATRTAPTVFIAVATPGVDSGGHLFRVDGSVVAPLSAARATALPTVAAIAARLSGLLDSRSPP